MNGFIKCEEIQTFNDWAAISLVGDSTSTSRVLFATVMPSKAIVQKTQVLPVPDLACTIKSMRIIIINN